MKKRSKSEVRRNLILSLFVLGSITAIIVMPFLFGAKAAGQKNKGLFTKTESADPSLPNYDIRTEKDDAIVDFFVAARNAEAKMQLPLRISETGLSVEKKASERKSLH